LPFEGKIALQTGIQRQPLLARGSCRLSLTREVTHNKS